MLYLLRYTCAEEAPKGRSGMGVGEKITAARKAKGWSLENLGEEIGVSVQAVSKWEKNQSKPNRNHLVKLSDLLGMSLEELLADRNAPGFVLGSPYFDPDRMYTFVKAKAQAAGMTQTLAALPLMREKHAGVYRDGSDVPYSVHPLTLACHALAMNIVDDDVLATALLHDVVEDTGTKPEGLPAEISEKVRTAVCLVSYNTYLTEGEDKDPDRKDEIKPVYYGEIKENPLAALVKCLDRCNNLSSMAAGFTKEKMIKYVKQTEEYVLPLLDVVKAVPEWNNAAWLLRYQMVTMLEAFKRLL